ncbi:aureochrome1-like protein [Plasmopara halstedii]|uniref:Aureochrome1-like protein n=1 Tax=Plasmopara halstedii TaxID=4781 RepID=A0A0P1AF20_PLAHL|nr:aureochrome1-like protein [Plasmopara halstedii]CEG39297.1 aureochrome1-like protein [Plasmopara halstedii]|eukprot:XP_024575666.1 aureochrome1-like protein [Plasmopara halstedii]
MPIVLPPIGPLFECPTAILLSYESEEQREQHEEDMARYFGVPLPDFIRRKHHNSVNDAVNLRTPTSVQPTSGYLNTSPVKKESAKPKMILPLFQLNSPTQVHNTNEMSEEEEKLRVSRERNRLHAQRTRIRKRELLERLKERIEALQDEYELLKQAYDFHATAVCLLRLGNVRNAPCVQKLELVGMNSTEDRDEDGQLCEAINLSHESDGDVEIDETHEQEFNINGKRSYMSTMSSNSMVCSKEERERVRRERNRLHARRARLRKKVVLERSQQAVQDLRERNDRLRNRLNVLVSSIYGSEACDDDVNVMS